jgi:S-formylglutathione hydrolase FrmB
MAFLQAHFRSPVLNKQTALYAIVPEQGRGPFPVLYLLHGLSDDHTIWERRTRVEIYVQNLPLIVVMPDGLRGFYTDNHAGPAYGRYMTEDVIGFAERVLPAARKRAGRAIGGLSMGGYGAVRLALAHPDLFVSAHSHSGCLSLKRLVGRRHGPEFARIFGPRPRGSEHDLAALARRLKRRGAPIPKLKLDCGVEDVLLESNREFHAFLAKQKIPHEYSEHPGGHTWDYWDLHIREALQFHARALGIKP